MSNISKRAIKKSDFVIYYISLFNKIIIRGNYGILYILKPKYVLFISEYNNIYLFLNIDIKKNKDKYIMLGTFRSLLNNMIIGVDLMFIKKLNIFGIGYKAKLIGKKLILNLGFTHVIEVKIPNNIDFILKSPTELIIKGINKDIVGNLSSKIKLIKLPELYKGKGIRYSNDIIKLKETKKNK